MWNPLSQPHDDEQDNHPTSYPRKPITKTTQQKLLPKDGGNSEQEGPEAVVEDLWEDETTDLPEMTMVVRITTMTTVKMRTNNELKGSKMMKSTNIAYLSVQCMSHFNVTSTNVAMEELTAYIPRDIESDPEVNSRLNLTTLWLTHQDELLNFLD